MLGMLGGRLRVGQIEVDSAKADDYSVVADDRYLVEVGFAD